MSEGSRAATPAMQIVGVVLIVVGVLWLLLALQMDVTAPNSRVVNIGRLQERSNQLLLGGLVTLIGVVLLGFGSLRAAQSKGGAGARAQVAAEPPCHRDLALEPYKVWLVARYEIVRNEVLGAFVCRDKLFGTVDEALVHAHDLELAAVQERAARDAAVAAAAASARSVEVERQAQRRQWLQANRKPIVGAAVVVAAIIGGLCLSAFLSYRAKVAEIAAAKADVERLAADAAVAAAAAEAATKAYEAVFAPARKALVDAELAKLEITLIRGAYGLQYDARVRNGSRYHVADLSGRLRLFAAGVELPTTSHFSCCDEAEDGNGFNMDYDIAPGNSVRKEYAILSIDYQVSSPEMSKFVSDRGIPTQAGLAGNREIRLDSRAVFDGSASFVQAPVREDLGSRTRYTTTPVDFAAMAAALPTVAPLQSPRDAAVAAAVRASADLEAAKARLEALQR